VKLIPEISPAMVRENVLAGVQNVKRLLDD
jgi:hypothetical protein